MLGLPFLSRRAELPVVRAGRVRQVRQDPHVSAPLFSSATGLALEVVIGTRDFSRTSNLFSQSYDLFVPKEHPYEMARFLANLREKYKSDWNFARTAIFGKDSRDARCTSRARVASAQTRTVPAASVHLPMAVARHAPMAPAGAGLGRTPGMVISEASL